MLKFLLIPLNFVLFLGLSTVMSGDLNITQSSPDRIPVQGNCEVSITINKKDVTGFAKLQHAFPLGVQVEAIETAGATFTFAEQKMKWIWMALPEDEEFTIKYKLTVTDEYITEVELGGTFSYLEENERKSFYIPADILKVGDSDLQEEVIPDPIVFAHRSVTDLGNNKYKVDVLLHKEHVSGFAKIQEYVPEGASVKNLADQDAIFSTVNNKVKFVWMNLPEAKELTLSYEVDMTGVSASTQDITGEFAYIHDGQTLKEPVTFGGEDETPMIAKNTTTETNEESTESEEDPYVETETDVTEVEPQEVAVATEVAIENEENPEPEVVEETETLTADVSEETAPVEEEQEKPKVRKTDLPDGKKITTVPDPNTGINYRVQILAGHNNVQQAYFQEKYNYSNSYIVENHEGWMKYTTGDFLAYKQARDGREEIKSNYTFPGPFVVAYNNGERITVQEALMISNQKWVK